MKKKRYPTYRRKSKRKKQPAKKIITGLILCITIALCNGWKPPDSLDKAREQSEIFCNIFFTYIEENTKNFSENISEAISHTAYKILEQTGNQAGGQNADISLENIPEYSGSPCVELDGNIPEFSAEKKNGPAYEFYSELDALGRCGYAESKITPQLMPTEERGAIGMIKPTGWHTVKYDNVDGRYLYNRCHLIGYQLTGENANEKNLITGTRYLNIEGMLPFENMVADYVKETDQHVMYRVTPVFEGDNLLAAGVLMEGKSVEDNGEGVLFCVFAYNVQPGVSIDYATGESSADGTIVNDTSAQEETKQFTSTSVQQEETQQSAETQTYVLNTNTHKFHKPGCYSVEKIKPENYAEFTGTREEAIAYGYDPCKNCNP